MASGAQTELSLDPGFIEDVGQKLKEEGIDDVSALINKLQLRYQHIKSAETSVLQQRQRLQQKLQYLKQTVACVNMLMERREAGEEAIVDYCLAGALATQLSARCMRAQLFRASQAALANKTLARCAACWALSCGLFGPHCEALTAGIAEFDALPGQALLKHGKTAVRAPELAGTLRTSFWGASCGQVHPVPHFAHHASHSSSGCAANVFAKARVPPAESVNLWLGADIMLEYPIAEAKEVLDQNLSKCEEALTDNKNIWDRLKDCRTTAEVNIARCYNHGVQNKKPQNDG